MNERPSWFPVDYDSLRAGLHRHGRGIESRLTCWPFIERPEALPPEDHLEWARTFQAIIKELSEPLGMVTYKRKTGDSFYAAMLFAIEGIHRERADSVDIATDIAAGDIDLTRALERLDAPPVSPAAEPQGPTTSMAEMIGSLDPTQLEAMMAAIDDAQRELEEMPSFMPAPALDAGMSDAVTSARQRVIAERASLVDPALLAGYREWPRLEGARVTVPVPPNDRGHEVLSPAADHVEASFVVAPPPAQLRAVYRYWAARDLWPLVDDTAERLVFERGTQRVVVSMTSERDRTSLRVWIKTTSPVTYH